MCAGLDWIEGGLRPSLSSRVVLDPDGVVFGAVLPSMSDSRARSAPCPHRRVSRVPGRGMIPGDGGLVEVTPPVNSSNFRGTLRDRWWATGVTCGRERSIFSNSTILTPANCPLIAEVLPQKAAELLTLSLWHTLITITQ